MNFLKHTKPEAIYPLLNRAVFAAIFLISLTEAYAQGPKLKDIEFCNGVDVPPTDQINGCSAVIDAGSTTPRTLAVAHNNRGNAYVKLGQYDRALQDFDQSIKINPGYVKAFNNRGVAYQKKGDIARAIKDFDSAIKLDAKYAGAFVNRANAYSKTGEYSRATRDYDEAIRIEPSTISRRPFD